MELPKNATLFLKIQQIPEMEAKQEGGMEYDLSKQSMG